MKCTSWKTLDEGKILLARLNQPKANVLDAAMIGELNQGDSGFDGGREV